MIFPHIVAIRRAGAVAFRPDARTTYSLYFGVSPFSEI